MFTDYEDMNRVPIAVIDEDFTELSQKMLSNLSNHDALNLRSTDKDQAFKLIERNYIEAIFILKKGFQENIKKNNFDGSIQLIYLDKSNIAPAMGDIVASAIISDLAIYKAANTSVQFESKYDLENLFDKTEKKGYELLESNSFEMTVESQVKKPNALLKEDIQIQKFLKTHVTLGFSLVVFSFVFLFSSSYIIDAKKYGVEEKLLTIGFKSHHLFWGQWHSLLISAFLMSFFQIIFIVFNFKLFELKQIEILLMTYSLHGLFLINLTLLFTRMMKHKHKYQSLLAPLIFLLGLVGGAFWSVELLSESFQWVSNLSPFYWSLNLLDQMVLNVMDNSYIQSILTYLLFNVLFLCLNLFFYHVYFKKQIRAA
jgi:ABC-2 type transport system permease protein